jgi:hypothetical protein
MKVDEDQVRLAFKALEQPADFQERGACGVQVDGAGEVDDAPPHPVLADHGVAAAGIALQVVRRTNDAVGLVQELVDLPVLVDVIPGRDHVDTGFEYRGSGSRRDPQAAGNVLAVGDDQVWRVPLAQRG